MTVIPLDEIYAEIEARSAACMAARPSWPCRRGCDHCCRTLANVPDVSETEWRRMWREIEAMDSAEFETVRRRMQTLQTHEPDSGHVICPLLDRNAGACRIYAGRPAACRMYGFYVTRTGNLWCDDIQALDDAGELDGVVVGNGSAVGRQLRHQFGAPRPITDWFAEQIAP